jgi:hypothetical protein
MFAAIEREPSPLSLADEIARMAAHLDAATHHLLTCIRRFDESGEWYRDGALSCAHWLTWRIGLDPGTAREKVRVARALGVLPKMDETLRSGALSYAKVRALTRLATPANEEDLLEMARYCTGAQLERLCRMLRTVIGVDQWGNPLDDRRAFSRENLENGMVRLSVVLHPDEAALVMKAIEHARAAAQAGVSAETRGRMMPKMDALVSVAETYLAHADAAPAGTPADRTQVFVHLDHDPLSPDGTMAATLDDGTRVSAETLRRLTCDAAFVGIHHHPDGAITPSRRKRTVSSSLRRALLVRDRGCRFPGCTNHLYLHAHHIIHWADGGPTSADNLALLCSTHHRLLHEGGFRVEGGTDGNLRFINRRGATIAPAPLAWEVGGDAASAIREWTTEAGVTISEQTNEPQWDGEPVDYRWVADAFITAHQDELRPEFREPVPPARN